MANSDLYLLKTDKGQYVAVRGKTSNGTPKAINVPRYDLGDWMPHEEAVLLKRTLMEQPQYKGRTLTVRNVSDEADDAYKREGKKNP